MLVVMRRGVDNLLCSTPSHVNNADDAYADECEDDESDDNVDSSVSCGSNQERCHFATFPIAEKGRYAL